MIFIGLPPLGISAQIAVWRRRVQFNILTRRP